MSAPTTRPHIALRHRLPHLPDPLSAERALDEEALATLELRLERDRVLTLSASSSAAAITHLGHALKRISADAHARTLLLSCHDPELMTCLREALQALQSALPQASIPWLAMRADRDAHIAQLLDLLASHQLQLVLLGIDALDPQEASYLASTCARYLSEGRLLLVALSTPPKPWFKADDLLIHSDDPHRRDDGLKLERREALMELARPLLAAPYLPASAYALEPIAAAIDAAVKLGWLREVNAEWARAQHAPAPTPSDEAATLALIERLTHDAAQQDPNAALIALIIGQALMPTSQRVALLTRWLPVWLGRGLGSTLWRLFERMEPSAEPLEALRLEVAAATLSPERLAALPAPARSPADASAPLANAWSRVLLWRGATQAAWSWCSRHQLDPQHGQLARVLSVHALMGQRRFEQAYDALVEPLEGIEAQELRWRQITAALCLVWCQERERARAMLEPWARLPTPARGWLDAAASMNLARALHLVGELELASALLEQLKLPQDELSLPEYQHNALLHLRALLALERLDLELTLATLKTLGPMRESMTSHGVHLQGMWAYLCIQRAHFEPAQQALATLHKMSMTIQSWDHLHLWRIYDTQWRQYLIGWSAPLAEVEGAPAPSAMLAHRQAMMELERAWRLEPDPTRLEMPPNSADASLRSWAMARRGDHHQAQTLLADAQLELQGKQDRLTYVKQLRLAQVAMALGLFTLARASLAKAQQLMGSTLETFAMASELELVLGWSQHHVTPEELLSRGRLRGFAARIARGLLGQRAEDLLEAQLIEQLSQTQRWRAQPLERGLRPQWCLIVSAGRCIGEDGAEVTLSGKALELMIALAGAPEQRLTKEALLSEVWALRDYHPLKHDNRLRMAIFKLRQALPPALALDALEDGYQLISGVALIKTRE